MSIDFSCNYGLGSIILRSHSESPGIYTYTSSNPSVASFVNDSSYVLYINNVGSTIITISQSSTRNYLTNSISVNLTVNPNKNNKTKFDIPTIEFIDTSLYLPSYTINVLSTAPIVYSLINATNPNCATIESDYITFNASGSFQIQMYQEAYNNYISNTIISSVITVPPPVYLDFNLPSVQYTDISFNLMNYITYKNITAYINFQLLDTNYNIIPNNSSSIASIDSYNNIYFYNSGSIKVKAYIDACSNYLETYSSNSRIISVNVYDTST